MTYTPPTITVTPAGGSPVTLSSVTYATVNAGKQYFTDNWQARTLTLEFIPSASTYTPKATDLVIMTDSNGATQFYGYVIESSRQYAIPYNASTGATPGDRVQIVAQGPIGKLGQVSVSWTASGAAFTAQGILTKIMTDTGVSVTAGGLYYYNPYVNPTATTVTDSGYALDMVNQLARTANWIIVDSYNNLGFLQPQTNQTYYAFTDSGSGIKYNSIEFVSTTRNQNNTVNVLQDTGTTQTATSGATYSNAWDCYTYFANNDADAASLAGYYLNTMLPATPPPFRISVGTVMDNSVDVQTLFPQRITGVKGCLGFLSTITLRGTTYSVVPIGLSATWYPDQMVGNVYFMPSVGAAFTLDSTTTGVLDQNVLGLP